jgi:RHS repeat-associated protein
MSRALAPQGGGMELAGRHWVSSDRYRFGFQGQEGDDEWNGEGNMLAFKYRVHHARLGRFLSIDPLAPDYPWNSPFAFSENRVIDGVDLEGSEWHRYIDIEKKTILYVVKCNVINGSAKFSNQELSQGLQLFYSYTAQENSFDYLQNVSGFEDWSVDVKVDATFVDPKAASNMNKSNGYWVELIPGIIPGRDFSTGGTTQTIGDPYDNYIYLTDNQAINLIWLLNSALQHPRKPHEKASHTRAMLIIRQLQSRLFDG